MDFDRDVRVSNEKVAPILNATKPDLRSFRARGGKLIQYHGWGDAAIAAPTSIKYYEAVRSFMASAPDPRSTAKSVEDFYRLFMVPAWRIAVAAWGRCTSGTTPISARRRRLSMDAERDVLSALERWVEHGIAPDRLIGSGPSPLDPTKTLTTPAVSPSTAGEVQGSRGHKRCGELCLRDAGAVSSAMTAIRMGRADRNVARWRCGRR